MPPSNDSKDNDETVFEQILVSDSDSKDSNEPEYTDTFTKTDYEIVGQIYTAFVLFGAKSDLLGTVGSWKETISDELVLSSFQHVNNSKIRKLESTIKKHESTLQEAKRLMALQRNKISNALDSANNS